MSPSAPFTCTAVSWVPGPGLGSAQDNRLRCGAKVTQAGLLLVTWGLQHNRHIFRVELSPALPADRQHITKPLGTQRTKTHFGEEMGRCAGAHGS